MDLLPRALHKEPPSYPAEALRARVQGRVMILATVGADGLVKESSLLHRLRVSLIRASTARAVRGYFHFGGPPRAKMCSEPSTGRGEEKCPKCSPAHAFKSRGGPGPFRCAAVGVCVARAVEVAISHIAIPPDLASIMTSRSLTPYSGTRYKSGFIPLLGETSCHIIVPQ
ncbi:MAG: hypothetical protein CME06_14825 [Gemmatimonadetes bacterium]|nr:hypothetical protein [Gemmatimonadota bacterium]